MRPRPHQRDRHEVGHRDDEVEIRLAEPAVFQIDVDRAERLPFAVAALAHQRRAHGIGKVLDVLRLAAGRLIGDPHGVALA